jgi:hypothetical protein
MLYSSTFRWYFSPLMCHCRAKTCRTVTYIGLPQMYFVYCICVLSTIICNEYVVMIQQYKTNMIIFIWNLIKYITYITY